jgi:hypothetical protein
MPLYKYKSFEDARHALWNYNPGIEYYKRVARLFNLAFNLSPPRNKKGVFPFRNISEANTSRMHQI